MLSLLNDAMWKKTWKKVNGEKNKKERKAIVKNEDEGEGKNCDALACARFNRNTHQKARKRTRYRGIKRAHLTLEGSETVLKNQTKSSKKKLRV